MRLLSFLGDIIGGGRPKIEKCGLSETCSTDFSIDRRDILHVVTAGIHFHASFENLGAISKCGAKKWTSALISVKIVLSQAPVKYGVSIEGIEGGEKPTQCHGGRRNTY